MNDKPKSSAPVIIAVVAVAAIALLAGCCVLPIGGMAILRMKASPSPPVIERIDLDHGDMSPTPEKKPYGIP